MADEIKDKSNDLSGPPPDPDEVNPNAVSSAPSPTPERVDAQAAPTPGTAIPLDLSLDEEGNKFKKIISNMIEITGAIASKVREAVQNPMDEMGELDTVGKLKISAIVLLMVLFGVVIRYWGGQWLVLFKDHTVYRLSDKATTITELDPNAVPIEFDHQLLVPQYIVLLNKVVVNLKKSERSGDNPMAAFNIFLHATNQEAGVEIKDRERELQDFVQRITEGFSYDQLLSENGKRKWKSVLKSELNMVLTRGRIKDIYFNTLLIKP